MKQRRAVVRRKTGETDIELKLNLDGTGKSAVSTGMAFLDHMLELFSKHSLSDLRLRARGDLAVDEHHSVEDIGICLGEALRMALGAKRGIVRYGFWILPMDETLVSVSLDLSGRPYLRYAVKTRRRKAGTFDIRLIEDFLYAFVNTAGVGLHVDLIRGGSPHHVAEAVFKALGRSLGMAAGRGMRIRGVPSTKGRL